MWFNVFFDSIPHKIIIRTFKRLKKIPDLYDTIIVIKLLLVHKLFNSCLPFFHTNLILEDGELLNFYHYCSPHDCSCFLIPPTHTILLLLLLLLLLQLLLLLLVFCSVGLSMHCLSFKNFVLIFCFFYNFLPSLIL